MKNFFLALFVAGLATSAFAQAPLEPVTPPMPGDKQVAGTEARPGNEAKPVTVTGCLQANVELPNTYILVATDKDAAKASLTYKLTSSIGVDLKAHVGHEVQVTGKLMPSTASAFDEKAPVTDAKTKDLAATSSVTQELSVTALKQIADTCAAAK